MKDKFTIGKLTITLSRWPWQKFNAHGMLNPAGARFGGGWKYKLGIDVGGTTVILNLIWGMIRFSYDKEGKPK